MVGRRKLVSVASVFRFDIDVQMSYVSHVIHDLPGDFDQRNQNSSEFLLLSHTYYFFRPFVPTSICPSRYLFLILWAEFNQTCYMTSPHGTGVREQHYFSFCLSVCSSIYSLRYLLLNHLAVFDQTCYMPSPRDKVCESNIIFLSVRPFVCLSVMLCSPKPLGWI